MKSTIRTVALAAAVAGVCIINECSAFQSVHLPGQQYHHQQHHQQQLSWKTKDLRPRGNRGTKNLHMTDNTSDNNDQGGFWEQQKQLMMEMGESVDKSEKLENKARFDERSLALVSDTAFFSMLIFCVLWFFFDNPNFPLSFVFGSLFGIAYVYGLSKYVATLGGSIDDVGEIQGAGVGQARFAFLILLFIFVGKFRAYGLMEIPTIMGFFTYQIASLSQGLREIND